MAKKKRKKKYQQYNKEKKMYRLILNFKTKF